jgi:hypothetical protein
MKENKFFQQFEGGWCVYDIIDTFLSNRKSRTKKVKAAEREEEERDNRRERKARAKRRGKQKEKDIELDEDGSEDESDDDDGDILFEEPKRSKSHVCGFVLYSLCVVHNSIQ